MLTDIVGYTAMAQRNEALTLELLAQHNDILHRLFAEYEGCEIKCTGDGFLAEFESPVRALECALAIQSALAQHFADSAPDQSLQVRIGIHLGDIVHQDSDVFGDGVNVTSRIEPLAEPGGICITRQVHDHVWNRVDARFRRIGMKHLKSLRKPVNVYRVLPSVEGGGGKHLEGTDRTRIAVLPFSNTSPDPADAYFADGMTEELIYTLSKIQGLHVIAQTSVMQYKDSPKAISEVAAELDVGSVLEGSVRKADDTVRITVQLIEPITQEHIWAERFDRRFEAVFDIQSEIAQHVAEALQVQLLARDHEQIAKKSTENLEAYTLFLRGRLFWNRRTPDSLNRAVALFRKAIDLDPHYALAHAGLADTLVLMPGFFSNVSSALTYPQARDAALCAIELDEALAEPHTTLGLVLSLYEFDFEEADRQFELAISLRPNYATAHHWRAILHLLRQRFDKAERGYHRALALDPLSAIVNADLGQFFYYSRQFDRAEAQLRDTLDIEPRFPYALTFLALTLLQKGEPEAALAELAKAESWTPEGIPWMGWAYGLAHCMLDQQDLVQDLLDRLLAKQQEAYVAPCHLAFLHFAMGQIDQGAAYLSQAFDEQDGYLMYVFVDPFSRLYALHPEVIRTAKRIHAERWLAFRGD
jgi:TolB-like protein/lipoprotein NlpI